MFSSSGILSKANTFLIGPSRNIKMKIRPYVRRYETIDEKSRRRKLPTSPDFAIYKPQLTTVLSLSHRFSGLALVSYTTLFGLGAIFSQHEFSTLVTMIEDLELSDTALLAMKFGLVYPFAFHTCCGIRHLLWDSGRFLTIKGVYGTGYAAIAGSFILAGILTAI